MAGLMSKTLMRQVIKKKNRILQVGGGNELPFTHVSFEVPVAHPSGDI